MSKPGLIELPPNQVIFLPSSRNSLGCKSPSLLLLFDLRSAERRLTQRKYALLHCTTPEYLENFGIEPPFAKLMMAALPVASIGTAN
jgi:hypothetical protein